MGNDEMRTTTSDMPYMYMVLLMKWCSDAAFVLGKQILLYKLSQYICLKRFISLVVLHAGNVLSITNN